MVSDTAKTRTRRRLRRAKMGKKRKRVIEKNGSTPAFPIHLENNEKPKAS